MDNESEEDRNVEQRTCRINKMLGLNSVHLFTKCHRGDIGQGSVGKILLIFGQKAWASSATEHF